MKIINKITGQTIDNGLDDFNAVILINEYQNDDYIIVEEDNEIRSIITLEKLLSHLDYMNKRGVDKLNIEDVIAMIKMIRLTDEV
tara:strand:+ start:473 stop:727 length:255 start_codon:yes stop_codon:yes gene_type:complete